MAAVEDDEYEIPLRDQRYFGSGLKRKRIQFVPSTTTTTTEKSSLPTTRSTSVAEWYLSIALNKTEHEATAVGASPSHPLHSATQAVIHTPHAPNLPEEERDIVTQCETCHKPLSTSSTQTTHECSIIHQICLQHSHPPSHIDRTRKGLNVLESQGWDPDTRLGLGSKGSEGRLYPVRAVENPNKAGLGAQFDKVKAKEKPLKLDAGKARLLELDGKKKAQRLRNAFYGSDAVERYLGEEQVHTELDLKAFERSRCGR